MKAKYRYIILFISGVISFPVAAIPQLVLPDSVSVVTTNEKPLQNLDQVDSQLFRYGKTVSLYNLDDVDKFEKAISRGLPANEVKAKALLASRINAMGKREFEEKLLNAYKGLALVIKHKINRYPAIIFDDHLVVYGVTDIEEALIRYQEFLQKGFQNE